MRTKAPRITFKLKPRATGLAAVGANPNRGYRINVGGVDVGCVDPTGGDWRGPLRGWSFYVSAGALFPGSEYVNTYKTLNPTADDAKAAAKAWVLEQFAKKEG